jgi:hypothetical protein
MAHNHATPVREEKSERRHTMTALIATHGIAAFCVAARGKYHEKGSV